MRIVVGVNSPPGSVHLCHAHWNANDHPVMARVHKPDEDKQMVVILDPADYVDWPSCPVEEASKYFKQWMGPLNTYDAPLPPKAPKSSSVKTTRPPKPPADPEPPPAQVGCSDSAIEYRAPTSSNCITS